MAQLLPGRASPAGVPTPAKPRHAPFCNELPGSDWCHWCKLMDEGVFAKEEWKTNVGRIHYS